MNLLKRGKVMISITASILLLIWLVLTLLVQREGPPKIQMVGDEGPSRKALVVYNPDLFYNLDEQICKAFAEGLAEESWSAKITTVSAAKELENEIFDLYVFCANTYNWAPDWPTTNFIKEKENLTNKHVVAITLGSGSTKRADRILKETIKSKNAILILSEEFWLMRPNNEHSTKSNVTNVLAMARALDRQVAMLKEK